jgi:hypothetical protein
MSEYAIVIDEAIDAVWLRDVCQREANKHRQRAATGTATRAVRANAAKADVFQKYADRFEYMRKEEVARIAATLKGGTE